jgi:pyruvate formate lyase activating enzyme
MNPDARLHVDTNGSILTKDYLDELVHAGMTDIGIDLKAFRLSTFMGITGLEDGVLANRYLEASWEAANYLIDNHSQVFLGISIPYNSRLISLKEVEEMGRRIAGIDPLIQVCVLDYRPEFQRLDIARPAFEEMMLVHEALRARGLESVICQTAKWRIGPSGELLP